MCLHKQCVKGTVSLCIRPITAEPTHAHTLDDVWGVANEVDKLQSLKICYI